MGVRVKNEPSRFASKTAPDMERRFEPVLHLQLTLYDWMEEEPAAGMCQN